MIVTTGIIKIKSEEGIITCKLPFFSYADLSCIRACVYACVGQAANLPVMYGPGKTPQKNNYKNY